MQFIIINQTFHGSTFFLQWFFVHFVHNTANCHIVFGQHIFWLPQNISYLYITNNDITNVVNGYDYPLNDLLSTMQAFNANIKGCPQLIYKKLKLLKNLIDHKGMCTLCFTLSISDTHWQHQIQLLKLDINGSKTDPPLSILCNKKLSENGSFFNQILI